MDSLKPVKKVLIIAPDYPPSIGGVEKFVSDLTRVLPREKFQLRVLCGSRLLRDLTAVQVDQMDDVVVTRIPTRAPGGMDLPKKLRYYGVIFRELKNADIVHLNDVRVFFTATMLGKLLFNYKIVLTSHGFIFHTQRHALLKKIYTYYFVHALKLFASQVITVGQTDEDFCRQKKLASRLIDEGVDLTYYQRVVRKPQRGNFLYFGRIDTNKNLPALLRVLQVYAQSDPTFRLLICGAGASAQMQALQVMLTECNLTQQVELKGKVSTEALLNYMAQAEFVFLPSTFESFGYTLIEALAAGCTVIAEANAQFRAMVGMTDAAYLVNMQEADVVCHTIQAARANYQPVRHAAIKLAARYDLQQMGLAYTKIFQDLACK